MLPNEAIAIIKSNWPDERYTMLREALNLAISSLSNGQKANMLICVGCGKEMIQHEAHLCHVCETNFE